MVPLPFNPISLDINPDHVPGNVRLRLGNDRTREFFDPVNISELAGVLMILPETSVVTLLVNTPEASWHLETSLTEGASSNISIDLKLIPVYGVFLTSQQMAGITLTSMFIILSLVVLLYRWHFSKDSQYLYLIPLLLFVIGFVLPWFTRTQSSLDLDYTTYISPILGYRLWHLDSLFFTIESVVSSNHLFEALWFSMFMMFLTSLSLAVHFIWMKFEEILLCFSIIFLLGGTAIMVAFGGLPLFGFWCMFSVPFLTYLIRSSSLKSNEDQVV